MIPAFRHQLMVDKRVRGALSCYVVDEYVLWSIRTRAFASTYTLRVCVDIGLWCRWLTG